MTAWLPPCDAKPALLSAGFALWEKIATVLNR
ncbi:hypothetical protein HNP33_001241 [Comamonas odontotermitis]|uniref:Uncharacterized protein n=1 Tax=Comamonas odontotermitis TaxID=379895 RepID=A0ABR6RDE7_9BURK|nr:hypothetical protein [Comamonas odontotermitis]